MFNFLRESGIHHVAEPELFELLKFFDSDEDGLLSFQDFIQMVLPCEDNKLRSMVTARPSHRVGRYDFLPRDIEIGVSVIIEKEIYLQRRIEELKRQLQSRYDYSPLFAFRSIDRYNIGRIDTYNLNTFLKSNEIGLSELELLAIIRRIDTDGDACLDFNEFSDFLKPLSMKVAIPDPRILPDPRAGSPKNRGGSPLRGGPPVPPPLGPPPGATLFVTPKGNKLQRPVLKVSDEDELIVSLREQCKLE